MDCLFCNIVNKKIPSSIVYEDDLCTVFMDIFPSTNGHLLLIPKNHYENIFDVDLDFINHSFKLLKEHLYPLLKKKLNIEGLTIMENNFYGQEIKHFHIHLIPRYKDDEFNISSNKEILLKTDTVFKTLL